ncbi:epoxyqueuosine reductase QueH [Streptococcus hongkongensis]|nr:DNA integration/recombination/inversion protein [Streptococcus uberis]
MIEIDELLDQMKPNQKVNYDRLLQKMIEKWSENEERPSILLHVCCAPCSTYSLEYLTEYADVTVYFANSNIHPKEEYMRRALVTQQFIADFNQDTGQQVSYIEEDYQPSEYVRLVRGLEQEPEGGSRCHVCFDYRLDKTAKKALDLGFDYFASALTISPHKNAQLINSIGIDIQKIYNTKYLPSDFKKNNGYRRSVELCETYDIYRQCYCGCVYAASAQGVPLKSIRQEAKDYLQNKDPEVLSRIAFNYKGKRI